MTVLAALSLAIWVYLLLGHGRFWQAGPVLPPAPGFAGPPVTIVIPARDEAASIGRCLRSLLAQDYAGGFRIVLVDDRSRDGTGDIARDIDDERLTVITGAEPPAGWSGKLWALAQGVAGAAGSDPSTLAQPSTSHRFASRAGVLRTTGPSLSRKAGEGFHESPLLLFTDADIEHRPGHLASLVAKAEAEGLDLVSEMVALNCASPAERALVPAFVFFFQLLYPFALVNDPGSRTAAAAGGTMLVRAEALARTGALQAMRGALIDDVTLARHIKARARIWLGHSAMAASIRPYPHPADVWRMVARTAYVQLRYSPALLAATIAGMGLVWWVPLAAALFAHGPARLAGSLAWVALAGAYVPTLRRFGLSVAWAPLLPAVATFYMAATMGSAWNHHAGQGVTWKQRAYRD